MLRKYFGFSSFRPGQMEASLAALHGKDVFVRMATGSGKSLCMFLSPLSKSDEAIGVVISPLNGLMDQQVRNDL
jgi:ATP-dependent DNA helicase RecQ